MKSKQCQIHLWMFRDPPCFGNAKHSMKVKSLEIDDDRVDKIYRVCDRHFEQLESMFVIARDHSFERADRRGNILTAPHVSIIQVPSKRYPGKLIHAKLRLRRNRL